MTSTRQLTTFLILTLSVLTGIGASAYSARFSTNEKRYLVLQYQRNWYGAFNLGKANSMNVLAIESSTENDLLYLYFRTQGFLSDEYWIGANDLEIDHFFVWVSTGGPIKYTFTNWSPGEPKNRKTKSERCALLPKNFIWKISNCYAEKYVICEEKIL